MDLYADVVTEKDIEIYSQIFDHDTERKNYKWSEKDIFLITYGDSITKEGQNPLESLHSFLEKYLKGFINGVHILPFFPYSSDDGFSVIDFFKVDENLGTWEDIKKIGNDYKLMCDLVINHASSQSNWFQEFLKETPHYSDFFIEENPDTDLRMVVRPRTSPLLAAFQTKQKIKYVWTTFSDDQIDLNFKSLAVFNQMVKALIYYLMNGSQVIRLDAIAFLWKEAGTSCLHHANTHKIVKMLRLIAEQSNPDAIILTETNVPNQENLSYFGNNDEADMVYQFSLPPLLIHCLYAGTSLYLNRWAATLPDLPPNCTFFNFTSSHDGIGVRPLEGILPKVEFDRVVEQAKCNGAMVSYRNLPDGSKTPYELNITFFDVLKDIYQSDSNWTERFICSQIIMLEMRGIPAFYFHSLLASPSWYSGFEQTQRARTLNRQKYTMEYLDELLGAVDNIRSGIFHELLRICKIRKLQPAFHPSSKQNIVNCGEKYFILVRQSDQQKILCVSNITSQNQKIDTGILGLSSNKKNINLITNMPLDMEYYLIKLKPYQCIWVDMGAKD